MANRSSNLLVELKNPTAIKQLDAKSIAKIKIKSSAILVSKHN
jgi:hypothetical protein